jgi:hypothetical protein
VWCAKPKSQDGEKVYGAKSQSCEVKVEFVSKNTGGLIENARMLYAATFLLLAKSKRGAAILLSKVNQNPEIVVDTRCTAPTS